jgi:predicted alpha/beta-fold hydrolase
LRDAQRRGWGATALNFRSCSGEPNRLARSYSSGETNDPRWVLAQLRARGIDGPLLAIGFSLGANALLKLLAEDGDQSPLVAAAAVSPPCDLARSAHALDAAYGLTALYRWSFLRSLKAKALAKAVRFPDRLSRSAIRAAHGLVAFDDAVTAPLNGFTDARDYYARCSSAPLLPHIRRPTLLLVADDDPMVSPFALTPEAYANPQLTVERTARGGHVGFVAGSVLRPVFWGEQRALDFLSISPQKRP